ncbi:MAG: hypothetical protein HOE90_20140, partial [Bacteriovoracaceae bacterium]|nr:hypothetical protein [Bacteriovoracaceae bacterium]
LAQQELDRMSRPDGLDNPSEQPLSDEALAGREQLDADALARRQEAERVQIGRDAKKDPSAIEADTLEEQLARERAAAAEAAEFDAPEAQAARVEEGRIHRPVDDKTSDDMLIRKVDEDHHTAAEAQVELDRRRKVREADARASVEREARDEAERAVASKRARVDEVDDAISDVELRMQELKTQEERLLRGQFEGDNPQQAYDDIQRERGELAERRGSLLEEQHELGQ